MPELAPMALQPITAALFGFSFRPPAMVLTTSVFALEDHFGAVSYTLLRAPATKANIYFRLLLAKKNL